MSMLKREITYEREGEKGYGPVESTSSKGRQRKIPAHLQDYLQSLENVRLFHFGVLIEHQDSELGSNSGMPGS